MIKEDDGSYSAIVLNLPGAGSCGDSEDQAIENAREAVVGAIRSYLEHGEDVPWKDVTGEDLPEGCRLVRVLVNVD